PRPPARRSSGRRPPPHQAAAQPRGARALRRELWERRVEHLLRPWRNRRLRPGPHAARAHPCRGDLRQHRPQLRRGIRSAAARGWQLLNYTATVSISSSFAISYLGVFGKYFWLFDLLKNSEVWHVGATVVLIGLLVVVNVIGIQESSALNLVLAMVDLVT